MNENDEDAPEVIEVQNAPESIWLNVGDLDGSIDLGRDTEGVTWCDTSQGPHDVEYVRADLVSTLKETP